MNFLDILTSLSFLALIIDISLQIRRIEKTKSSRDISLTGVFFRFAASVIVMFKLISLKDVPLIIGQGLFVLTFAAYFYLVATHIKHRRKR